MHECRLLALWFQSRPGLINAPVRFTCQHRAPGLGTADAPGWNHAEPNIRGHHRLRVRRYEYARVGFLEKGYENALVRELRKAGLNVAQQHGITVRYDDIVVEEYTADILVEGVVVVELKAVRTLDGVHTAQCINYLRASGLRMCLLLNFGKPRVGIHRVANGV